MAELFEIISTRLEADTASGGMNEAVEGAVGGFHRGKAPEGTGYCRVHVSRVTGIPVYTATTEYVRKVFVQFTVFAKDPQGLPGESAEAGGAKAARLARRVVALFADAAEGIADPAFVYSRLDREMASNTEVDAVNASDIYSEGCVMEMWTA